MNNYSLQICEVMLGQILGFFLYLGKSHVKVEACAIFLKSFLFTVSLLFKQNAYYVNMFSFCFLPEITTARRKVNIIN